MLLQNIGKTDKLSPMKETVSSCYIHLHLSEIVLFLPITEMATASNVIMCSYFGWIDVKIVTLANENFHLTVILSFQKKILRAYPH